MWQARNDTQTTTATTTTTTTGKPGDDALRRGQAARAKGREAKQRLLH